MRSASAGGTRLPVSSRPPDSRSIQSRPSGLSITSTMLGSSRYAAIDAPSAVRSMRAPRAKASDRNETAVTTNPAKSPHAEADGSAGLIRKRRKWAKATSLMGGGARG
jgi:hypothetical protein